MEKNQENYLNILKENEDFKQQLEDINREMDELQKIQDNYKEVKIENETLQTKITGLET